MVKRFLKVIEKWTEKGKKELNPLSWMLPCKLKPPWLRGNGIRKKSGKDLTTKRPTPSNQQYTAVEFCDNDNGCIKFLAYHSWKRLSSCFGLKCTKCTKLYQVAVLVRIT